MNEDLKSYTLFVLLGLCSTLALNFYLKKRLGTRWDSSLKWFIGGLLCWVLLLWLEISSTSLGQIQDLRRILSIVNSISFIMFLSYFDEGWIWLNQKIKWIRATPERFAIFLVSMLLLIAVTSFKDPSQWLIAETAMSILVSLLLTIGFAVSFWRRSDAWSFIPLVLIGGALLCWTQYLNLVNEQIITAFFAQDNLFQDLNKMRPLAFFCLLVNTFALSFTALGKEYDQMRLATSDGLSNHQQLTTDVVASSDFQPTFAIVIPKEEATVEEDTVEEETTSSAASESMLVQYTRPQKGSLVDSILISGATNHIEVTFRLKTQENVVLEVNYTLKELTKSMFSFLLSHCTAAVVKSSKYNNYPKEKRMFVEKLNAKPNPYGLEFVMDDFFAKGLLTLEYRLALPLDRVEIDESAQKILGLVNKTTDLGREI